MGGYTYENPKIDLICQICKDGSIIPLRFRLEDEDGLNQEFHVKGYRDKSEQGLTIFDCNVIVNGMSSIVTIYTSQTSREGIWYIKKELNH